MLKSTQKYFLYREIILHDNPSVTFHHGNMPLIRNNLNWNEGFYEKFESQF